MVTPPSSTYRLQIRRTFTLDDAAAVAGYLAELGAGAVYLSPILQSTPGSDHGYDTTDPARIDADRGGEQGWAALLAAAADGRTAGRRRHRAQPPRHRRATREPVLVGRADVRQESAYASWFDIDWSRPITVPVLGDDAVLSVEDGELRLLRAPLPAGSRDLDHRATIRRRCTSVSTTGWSTTRAATTSSATAASSSSPRWPGSGRRTRRCSRPLTGGWRRMVGRGGDRAAGRPSRRAGRSRRVPGRLARLAPEAWITVEKILEPGEVLPDWPVAGTTGYDAMREVNGVFVDPAGEAAATERYQRLTGDQLTSAEHVEQGKRMVVDAAARRRGRTGSPRWRRRCRMPPRPSPRWRWPSRSTGPTCPTGWPTWTRRWCWPSSADPSWPRRSRRCRRACTTRPTSWPDGSSS